MIPSQKILDSAAAPTLERIRQDRHKAPAQIQPLLDYLETHLFDPDLDANQLKRACGVRDNSLPIYFHHALALPPYAYIEDCRLEVACRMLSHSDLKVWQIGQHLGYSTLQVFSRAFHRWSGVRPSVYRRRFSDQRQTAAAGNGSAAKIAAVCERANEDGITVCMTTLRKAVSGGLEKREADELAQRLFQLYPDSFRGMGPAPANRLAAEDAWQLLRGQPWEQQREAVSNGIQFSSVELFHLLHEKSLEEGRNDRQLGVQLAELALSCARAVGPDLTPAELSELSALAWTWLANARRLALDIPGAEEALTEADAMLSENSSPAIRAELVHNKSVLKYMQGSFHEALRMADQALDLCGSDSRSKLAAQILINRAELRHQTGRLDTAVLSDAMKATEIVEGLDEPYLLTAAYQHLAVYFTKLGAHREAGRYLPKFKSLLAENELASHAYLIHWTEGLVASTRSMPELAEEHLREARIQLGEAGEIYDGALCSLDLAILYSRQSRFPEAALLAAEVIEIFEGFRIRRSEGLAAVQLLREAIAKSELGVEMLRKVRSSLGASPAPRS